MILANHGIISSSGGVPQIATNGLILNLDASNSSSYIGSGTTWTDLSSTGNNGTLTNGVAYSSSNGGIMTFDGVNDYVEMGGNSVFNLTNITISTWVKLDTTTGNNFILSRYYNTTTDNGWSIYYNPTTQKLRFDGRESSVAYIGNESNNNYSVNTWYNVVCVKSNLTWSIYVNGTLDMSQNIGVGNIAFSINNMQVGGSLLSYASNYGKNSIGSVNIYNRALNSTEITQNFNATKSRFGL
jgi:hypothetical protein